MPRYKFSLTYYPDSAVWNITHDLTGHSQQLKTWDAAVLATFLQAHLPTGKMEKALSKKVQPEKPLRKAVPKVPATPGVPRRQDQELEKQLELSLLDYRGKTSKHFAEAKSLGYVELMAKGGQKAVSQLFDAKVMAKSMEGQETVVLAELKEQKSYRGRLQIPVYETSRQLKPGMYRFTVTLHPTGAEEEGKELLGSELVMLN